MSPESTYAKPFLTVREQINRLRERAMACGSDSDATAVLERYGYYRLSGYWHTLRSRPSSPEDQFDDDGREVRRDAFIQAALLGWWQTPHPDLPVGDDQAEQSPLRLLGAASESRFTEIIQDTGALNSFVSPVPW